MSTPAIPRKLSWPQMPLAVYREVQAHLQQVAGIEVELLPQTSTQFNYALSQVGGLEINLLGVTELALCERVQQILTYYSDRFGPWQVLEA
jgi:hypothetical protein